MKTTRRTVETGEGLPRRSVTVPPVLAVEDLRVVLATHAGDVRLLDGVSFSLYPGEAVGIVGESGSGKTMTALSVMGLLPKTISLDDGRILFSDGRQTIDLARASKAEMREIRGDRIAMVFQDPMTSLNPLMTVGSQIAEGIAAHVKQRAADVWDKVRSLLVKVGIPAADERIGDYPHQFSGGMRQRIMVAMGLANRPAVLIADEPTTALDVTVQAQVLDLIRELTSSSNTATMLITHNLGIVAQLCSRVIIMYLGRIVEEGPVDRIFASPQHPYTYLLLQAMPRLDVPATEALANIPGAPPQPAEAPAGCKFVTRCPFRIERCVEEEPPLEAVGASESVRCWVKMDNVPPAERRQARERVKSA